MKQQDVMTLEMVQYEKTVSDLTMQIEEIEDDLKKEANEKQDLAEKLNEMETTNNEQEQVDNIITHS